MGARHFTELVAWQLSNRLKHEVYAFTSRPEVARDLEYCDQIRDSSASAPRNIAEGFGHFSHREFARFTRIARASLYESQDHLQDGLDRGHLPREEFARLWDLSRQALGASTALLKYLQDSPDWPT